jgi:hypothetical protein
LTDFENAFGYDTRIPENIREIFMWLCQDVAALQSKWDFYLQLYSEEENTDLLSELASWSFNIIEESLRNDMTMAICRLSDPSISMHKENLSLAALVEKCKDIPGLETQLADFQEVCKPISNWRNKQVGHNDLHTRIHPRENPLPGISKPQIDEIIKRASDTLSVVAHRYVGGDLNFHTIAQGGAEDLVFWLKSGRDHHSSA